MFFSKHSDNTQKNELFAIFRRFHKGNALSYNKMCNNIEIIITLTEAKLC